MADVERPYRVIELDARGNVLILQRWDATPRNTSESYRFTEEEARRMVARRPACRMERADG